MDDSKRSDCGPFPGPGPFVGADPGTDFDEWAAWLDREVAAGRDPAPPERAFPAQGICVSLGDAGGVDPGLLAAVSGLDDLGGEGPGPRSPRVRRRMRCRPVRSLRR
jgi:hypothetical protein